MLVVTRGCISVEYISFHIEFSVLMPVSLIWRLIDMLFLSLSQNIAKTNDLLFYKCVTRIYRLICLTQQRRHGKFQNYTDTVRMLFCFVVC